MRTRGSLFVGTIALLLVFSLAAGCSRAADDAEIAKQVKSRITEKTNVDVGALTVNADQGTVTLAGTVASEQERGQVAAAAAGVEGVKTVVNNLTVAEPETAQAEPEPEPTPQPARRAARSQPVRQAAPAEPAPRPHVYEETTQTQPAPAAAPAPAPEPQRVTVPAGTLFSVRMTDPVSTETDQVGDAFQATLESPIYQDGEIVIPRGADVEGRIVLLESAGRFKGRSKLGLQLNRLIVNGRSYQIATDRWYKEGRSEGKRTAATTGGGAALGAIIGGIAGGGKGAAIGAAAGAGAGAGVQGVTHEQEIEVKPEQVLNFTLQDSVTVQPAATRSR